MDNIFLQSFNLSELSIEKVEVSEERIRVFATSTNTTCKCQHCQKTLAKVHQRSYRELEDLPVFDKTVGITLQVRSFYCPDCKKQTSETFEFVRAGSHQTKRYELRIYK